MRFAARNLVWVLGALVAFTLWDATHGQGACRLDGTLQCAPLSVRFTDGLAVVLWAAMAGGGALYLFGKVDWAHPGRGGTIRRQWIVPLLVGTGVVGAGVAITEDSRPSRNDQLLIEAVASPGSWEEKSNKRVTCRATVSMQVDGRRVVSSNRIEVGGPAGPCYEGGRRLLVAFDVATGRVEVVHHVAHIIGRAMSAVGVAFLVVAAHLLRRRPAPGATLG